MSELIVGAGLIDRRKAVKEIDRFAGYLDEDMIYRIKYALCRIHIADVQPVVHGLWLTEEYVSGDPSTGTKDEWVERKAEQSDYYAYCSVCEKGAGYDSDQSVILSEFCPHCGARMDRGG